VATFTVIGHRLADHADTLDHVDMEGGAEAAEDALRQVWSRRNPSGPIWRPVLVFTGCRRADADFRQLERLNGSAPRAPIGVAPAARTVVGFWCASGETILLHERTALAIEGLILARERTEAALKREQSRGPAIPTWPEIGAYRVQYVFPGHISPILSWEALGDDWPY